MKLLNVIEMALFVLCCITILYNRYIKQLFQQFLVKLEMLKKRSVMSIVICCRIKGQGQTA